MHHSLALIADQFPEEEVAPEEKLNLQIHHTLQNLLMDRLVHHLPLLWRFHSLEMAGPFRLPERPRSPKLANYLLLNFQDSLLAELNSHPLPPDPPVAEQWLQVELEEPAVLAPIASLSSQATSPAVSTLLCWDLRPSTVK